MLSQRFCFGLGLPGPTFQAIDKVSRAHGSTSIFLDWVRLAMSEGVEQPGAVAKFMRDARLPRGSNLTQQSVFVDYEAGIRFKHLVTHLKNPPASQVLRACILLKLRGKKPVEPVTVRAKMVELAASIREGTIADAENAKAVLASYRAKPYMPDFLSPFYELATLLDMDVADVIRAGFTAAGMASDARQMDREGYIDE